MCCYRVFTKKLVSFLLVGLFCLSGQVLSGQAAEGAVSLRQEAYNAILTVEEQGRYAASLPVDLENALPMGIKRTLNNIEYIVAFTHAKWTPTGYVLSAFARVKIPDQGKTLFFAAQDIQFKEGNIVGNGRLALLGDISIPINGNTAVLTLKGNMNEATGMGGELTYMKISCKGFEELKITADLEFSDGLIVPVDANGEAVPGTTLKTSFTTVVTDWNDILLDVTLPPFAVKDLKGFVFNIDRAVFDFSDYHNAQSMAFPEGYEQYLIPGNMALWRGVYIKDFSITLPEYFNNRNSPGKRVSFAAQNLLLDNNGISGLFRAVNLLSIDEGSASGWRFSVNSFAFGFMANTWQDASFSGAIGLPVSEDLLAYEAKFSLNDEYYLKVATMNALNFDIFHAKAQIDSNSYVMLRVVDGAFRPEAMLNGQLSIAADLDGNNPADTTKKAIQFNGIVFQELFLSTQSPYFTAQYFGYQGEMKLANFPVSLNEIALHATGNQVALQFGVQLTLADSLFSGGTKLSIAAERHEEASLQHWRYKQTDLARININAKVAGAFSLEGYLDIKNNDPVYGDGFDGSLRLTFNALKEFEVTARAMFGCKEFRYWFVDGRVSFGTTGIPVFTGFNLNGFAGGVSYRMKRDGMNGQASPTGCLYVPDANSGVGVKAGVLFNVGSQTAVQGEASFEIAFNKHGGLNFMGFFGTAQFAGKIPGVSDITDFVTEKFSKLNAYEKKLGADQFKALEDRKLYEPSKAAEQMKDSSRDLSNANLAAAVGIQYDFTQQSLHATFDLYVNVVGGLLRGRASGNRAGWGVLHIDPDEWYLHMGSPNDKLGILLSVGGIVNVETGGYFMIGHNIPEAPPPPKEVLDILKLDADQISNRSLEMMSKGRGFATGMDFKVSTGDITFLILYANFMAGFGFDIMMKDYGDAQCKGRSGVVGIDGWYAQGQTYVYLGGELGVKVNLWFIKAKIPIIKGAAAALVMAKLPNPVWLSGYLGVKFELLGGLVKGSARFKLTLGEECDLVVPGSSPVDMEMISDLTPTRGSDKIDVFSAPQAAFNMAIGKTFEVEDDEGLKAYRIQLEDFALLDNGQSIQGKTEWNSTNDLASFYSHEIMPPDKELTAVVKVRFEQWRNNRWETVYTGGQMAIEQKETEFTTGGAPDHIPLHNVAYTYPVVSQQFVLKGESQQGYIQLERGQSYLFPDGYRQEIQINSPAGKQIIPFAYNVAERRIDFPLNLDFRQSYTLDVTTMPANAVVSEDAGSTRVTTTVNEDEDYAVYNKTAGNVTRSDVAFSVLNYAFKTGRYATFAEKMNNLVKGEAVLGRISSSLIDLQYLVASGTEPFDPAELVGNEQSDGALVRPTALLTDDYYTQDIYPLVYRNYPPAGIRITDRAPDELGVPPVRAIHASSAYLTEVERGDYSGLATRRFPFVYNLPQVYYNDFMELRSKLTNAFIDTPILSQYNYIVSKSFPWIRTGTYKVRFQYHLPGGRLGTSADFEYYNFIK